MIMSLSFPFWQQMGGGQMIEYIYTFFISVMARIVGHCVCKWLDRNDRNDN